MALQLAYFDRAHEPVLTDVGPVLDLEDVVAGKVCALASRAYERDYLDTAAALERFSPDELIALARRLDPGLEGLDFAEAAQRLDQMPDRAFTAFGLTQQDVVRMRERFAAWPRDAEAADSEVGKDSRSEQPLGLRDTTMAEPEEPEIEP